MRDFDSLVKLTANTARTAEAYGETARKDGNDALASAYFELGAAMHQAHEAATLLRRLVATRASDNLPVFV